MKLGLKIILIVLGLLLILGIVGYFQSIGVIPKFGWQGLSMLAATAAGPIKLLVNSFSGKVKYVDELMEKHQQIRNEEAIHRENMNNIIIEKEAKINNLNQKLDKIDSKLKAIDKEKQNVETDVMNMSDQEKQNEAIKVWG